MAELAIHKNFQGGVAPNAMLLCNGFVAVGRGVYLGNQDAIADLYTLSSACLSQPSGTCDQLWAKGLCRTAVDVQQTRGHAVALGPM